MSTQCLRGNLNVAASNQLWNHSVASLHCWLCNHLPQRTLLVNLTWWNISTCLPGAGSLTTPCSSFVRCVCVDQTREGRVEGVQSPTWTDEALRLHAGLEAIQLGSPAPYYRRFYRNVIQMTRNSEHLKSLSCEIKRLGHIVKLRSVNRCPVGRLLAGLMSDSHLSVNVWSLTAPSPAPGTCTKRGAVSVWWWDSCYFFWENSSAPEPDSSWQKCFSNLFKQIGHGRDLTHGCQVVFKSARELGFLSLPQCVITGSHLDPSLSHIFFSSFFFCAVLNFISEGIRRYQEQGRNAGALFDFLNVVNYLWQPEALWNGMMG